MAMYRIRLNLELTPGEDQVYTVTSPDVPGLVTEGSTPEEIRHNVSEALEVLMMGLKELGKELPPALRQPIQQNQVETDWSAEWQAREAEADQNLTDGDYEEFESVDDFIASFSIRGRVI